MNSPSIYKSERGRARFLQLYDESVDALGVTVDECVVDTRFGATHVLVLGPPGAPPLFVLHGGNTINAETLAWYRPLFDRYRIYAPDLMGHPGKSAQVRLPTTDLSYGQWAADVVRALNLAPIPFLGTSYGGSITLLTGIYAPDVIAKAALVVPGSIAMASPLTMGLKVLGPLLRYRLRGGEQNLRRVVQPIIAQPTPLNLRVLGYAFDHLHMADLLPPLSAAQLQAFTASTLLIAAENDIFFPARKVVPRAQSLLPHLVQTEVLPGSSHYPPPAMLARVNAVVDSFLQG